jgi:hypothetical protein
MIGTILEAISRCVIDEPSIFVCFLISDPQARHTGDHFMFQLRSGREWQAGGVFRPSLALPLEAFGWYALFVNLLSDLGALKAWHLTPDLKAFGHVDTDTIGCFIRL